MAKQEKINPQIREEIDLLPIVWPNIAGVIDLCQAKKRPNKYFAMKVPENFLGRWFWPWVGRDTGNDDIFLFRLIGGEIIGANPSFGMTATKILKDAFLRPLSQILQG